jgi:hypothetical protein
MGSQVMTTLLKGRNEAMNTNTAINQSTSYVMKDSKLTAVMLLLLACSQLGFTQQAKPRSFRSASEASQALYEAVKNNDETTLRSILGSEPELLSSGDEAKDKGDRDQFAVKYQEMHRLVREPDGTTVLYVGAQNWPFPIPLVSKHRKWYFDADTGRQEVLARSIGQNEVTAIQVCQSFGGMSGPAQEGASEPGPIQEFAVGLGGEKSANSGDREPFHGYYFRTLSGKENEVRLVAYPAEYGSTGVMTFAITSDGAVVQKDLGPDTPSVAHEVQRTGTDWAPVQLSDAR